MPTPLIQFENVFFQYPNSGKWILENINFSLYPGDRIGIIGDNGCGKSTICKLILGIEKPARGSVLFNGEEVRWNRHYPFLGYIGDPGQSEEMQALPTNITVSQIVEIIRLVLKKSGMDNQQDALFETLQIEHLLSKKTQNLSTGERKRVMIFTGLSKLNKLLILDEPFDGLDQNIKTSFFELLPSYLQPKTSVLYIAHNRMEIDLFSDKVFKMENANLHSETQRRFRITTNIDNISEGEQIQKLGQFQYLMDKLLNSNVSGKIEIEIQPINANRKS